MYHPHARARTSSCTLFALPPLHAADAPRVGALLLLGGLRGALRRLALRALPLRRRGARLVERAHRVHHAVVVGADALRQAARLAERALGG